MADTNIYDAQIEILLQNLWFRSRVRNQCNCRMLNVQLQMRTPNGMESLNDLIVLFNLSMELYWMQDQRIPLCLSTSGQSVML